MQNVKRQNLIRCLITVAVVVMMVGASELTGEREIIFPEITALAVGALIAPRRAWRTSRTRMLLLIVGGAALGLLISVSLPLPLWAKVSLAFLAAQFVYLFSGTTFAPLVSAVVLPVLLGTDSIVYPLAAFALTLIVVLVDYALEKLGFNGPVRFEPLPPPRTEDYTAAALRTVCVALLTALALAADARFCVAPPLLVAFTEFTRKNSSARHTPVRAVLLIVACACAGSLCRFGLTTALGLPLTLSALAATAVMLALMYANRSFLPPAGAMTILAMLIPAEDVALYPFHVLFGASLLMLTALLLFGRQRVKAPEERIRTRRQNEWQPLKTI